MKVEMKKRDLINYRPSLKLLKGRKELVGCEVGVEKGTHAENILKELDIKRLYLVDSYTPFYQWEKQPVNAEMHNDYKRLSLERLKKWEKKIVWIYKTSEEACKEIPDNSLDFVYIDANHQYEYVIEDIKFWDPKVKDGGWSYWYMIAGHDYNLYENDVNKAVHEIYGDRVNSGECVGEPKKKVGGKHRQIYDWWVWK